MTDENKSVILPKSAARALAAFADRTGQDPQALIGEAVERFVAEETELLAKVEAARANVEAGNTVPWDEAVRGFRDTIARAAIRRRAG